MTAWSSGHFELEQVAEGVYAAIVPEGSGAMGNAGFVNLGDRVIVFDTFNTPQAARDLRDAAIHFTGISDFIVVNSHWHGDHIRGNQVFAPAPILATQLTKEWIEKEHPGRILRQQSMLPQLDADIAELANELEQTLDSSDGKKQAIESRLSFLKELRLALAELKLTPPTLVVTEERIFSGKTRFVRLVACGAGHSPSDLVMEVPDAKVLFAGDLVSIENHPMLEGGDPENWIAILRRLERSGYVKVVPGHGPVGDGRALSAMERYLSDLAEWALRNSGDDTVPDLYRDWKADFLYKSNLNYIRTKTSSQ